MKPLSRDAHAPLIRAIHRIVAADGGIGAFLPDDDRQYPVGVPVLVIESASSTPWASVTFVGQLHRIAVRIEGESVAIAATQARLSALLTDAEIAVPGHIVADIALVGATTVRIADGNSRCRLRFDALTIED
jgi:hypothetical protein